jgi:signal peptidase I
MAIGITMSYSGYVARNLASSFGLRCTSVAAAGAGAGGAPGAGCRFIQDALSRPFCLFASSRRSDSHRDVEDHNHSRAHLQPRRGLSRLGGARGYRRMARRVPPARPDGYSSSDCEVEDEPDEFAEISSSGDEGEEGTEVEGT